tara:strand:- start:1624 stop:2181 length:558 start_codon:yes stop_codon:yes gene_type:complete
MPTFTLGGKVVFTQSGTNEPVLNTNAIFPTGHVIQTKNFKTTNRMSVSVTGSSTPSHASGASYFTFQFTPQLANSKLLLTSTNLSVNQPSNVGDNVYASASYDTTLIGSVLSEIGFTHWNGALDATYVCFNHLFDSWGTTEKTIDIRVGINGTETINCNRRSHSSYDNVPAGFHEQCFTVMEIAP